MYTITCTQSHVHNHVYTITCIQSRVHNHVYTITCTQSCVHNHMYTITCIQPRAYNHVYTITCIQPRVYNHVYTITCMLLRQLVKINIANEIQYKDGECYVLYIVLIEWLVSKSTKIKQNQSMRTIIASMTAETLQ